MTHSEKSIVPLLSVSTFFSTFLACRANSASLAFTPMARIRLGSSAESMVPKEERKGRWAKQTALHGGAGACHVRQERGEHTDA